MKQVYNFATIEMGPLHRGPGVVIGVMAIASDSLQVRSLFRKDAKIDDEIQSITQWFQNRSSAAGKANLTGIDLFRSFVAPRQASTRVVTRGTRFCEQGKEDEMMNELLERFTPENVLL